MAQGLKFSTHYADPVLGPVGDRALCALVNDLRVCAHLARPHSNRALRGVTSVAGISPRTPQTVPFGSRLTLVA
jgi:hypothetical protein